MTNYKLGLAAFAVLLASCSERPTASEDRHLEYGAARQEELAESDAVWSDVMSSWNTAKIHTGDDLADFLAQVELSNQSRRESGLAFWHKYPEDARRFDWLVITVNLPPKYPEDLERWALREARLPASNSEPIDLERKGDWNETYAALREEFWNSQAVTDFDRRMLRFGEVYHRLVSVRDSAERDDLPNAEDVIAELMAFFEAYPEPFGELDENFHSGLVSTLIGLVFHQKALEGSVGWDKDTALSFVNDLSALEIRMLNAVNDRVVDATARRSFIERLRAEISEGRIGAAFSSEEGAADRALAWSFVFGDQLKPPILVANDSNVAYIDVFNRMIAYRVFRDLGSRLWEANPDDHAERARWLIGVLGRDDILKPWFGGNGASQVLVSYLGHMAMDAQGPESWIALYKQMRAEFWVDSQTSNDHRGQIRYQEIIEEFWSLQRDTQAAPSPQSVQQLLNSIHQLYAKIEYKNGGRELFRLMLRDAPLYGLGTDAMNTFIARFEEFDDPIIAGYADSFRRLSALRSEPFEFVGSTMDGKPFDVSDLRGQLVLVDHWSTDCASCIAAMPTINRVFEEYRDYGFVVVSIAYDGTSEQRRVWRVKLELGLEDWISVNGEGHWEDVAAAYGYRGVPQYMLLRRDGTMFAGTAEVDFGERLPRLLNALLVGETKTTR